MYCISLDAIDVSHRNFMIFLILSYVIQNESCLVSSPKIERAKITIYR